MSGRGGEGHEEKQMEFEGLLLIISDKHDVERDAVARAWESGGGEVLRLGRFWDPPEVDPARVRVYGSDSFSLVLAQKLGLHLVSPPDDLLGQLERTWLGRTIKVRDLDSVTQAELPMFIKPVVPKLFRADVYQTLGGLQAECKGLEPETRVLVSDVVEFVGEARFFVLDGVPATGAIYEGSGDIEKALGFVTGLAGNSRLPATCVLDVGLMKDGDWALVETNATWGSGLNGCEAAKAAACIARATEMPR